MVLCSKQQADAVLAAVTMFSNSLYTAEEAAAQTTDTIPSWQGSQAQTDSSQVPSAPGGRTMATRTYSMPLARGPEMSSTSSPVQQTAPSLSPSRHVCSNTQLPLPTPLMAALPLHHVRQQLKSLVHSQSLSKLTARRHCRLPPRPNTPQGGLRSARMSRASSGALDSSSLTLSQQQRLQRLRVRPLLASPHHWPLPWSPQPNPGTLTKPASRICSPCQLCCSRPPPP